jgi:hypothetical protein
MESQWSLFSLKSRTVGHGDINWVDTFWGIFGQVINIHFGTVSPFSIFSIIQPLFLKKTKPLYVPTSQIFMRDLNLGRKELGI